MQITNGTEDNESGACTELIFAPIDRTIPDDAALLSSGFRMYSVGSNTVLIPLSIFFVGPYSGFSVICSFSNCVC